MSEGKAVVATGEGIAKIDFTSYASNHIARDPVVRFDYSGALIVFNGLSDILRPNHTGDPAREKMIQGLSAEISTSLVAGWVNVYFCSFEKYSDFGTQDLPDEFTTLDEDKVYYAGQEKAMIRFIKSCKPRLKSVRFAGIVSSEEMEVIGSALQAEEIKIETDSPFLAVVNERQ